jgi:PAS domain S-box-containing protein
LASAADLASLIDIEALKVSEARAKSILSSSPRQMAVLDSRGLIVICNPAWQGLGSESEQSDWVANSVGLHYRSVVAAAVGRPGEADAAQAWTGIEAVLLKRSAYFALEYPCDSGGAGRWIRLTVYPLIAPGEGVVVAHEDITGRKLTELRLDYERTQLRTLLETIPDYVWLKDPAGVYLDCNLAFQRLLGATQSAIIGKTDWDFLAAARADSIHQYHLKSVASEGSRVNEQIVNVDAADGPSLLEVTRTPMRDRHGMLLGVLAVGRDITARRRQEDELEQHRHHLEQLVADRTAALALAHAAADAEHRANAERQRVESDAKMRSSKLEATGTLAAGIAHDFNNILAAIVGFAEMTADELPPGSSAARNVAQILSGGFRARDLVARMLTFARASPVEATRVNIAVEVSEALVLLRASVSAAIEVSFDNALAGETRVLAAPSQIMQIVMNLCINASHAIENRGTISVRLASADTVDDAPPNLREGICLTVSDTGSGMTPEVRERLFDPFFTTKAPGEGSGLGLSVVYGIVSDMGGTIHVDSSTAAGASGSQFRVFLPLPSLVPA